MTAKTFFKKVGRGLQSGAGNLTNAAGKAAGSVLGKAAATYAMEEFQGKKERLLKL